MQLRSGKSFQLGLVLALALSPGCQAPLEAWNRSMFAVNEAIDDAVLEPVAKGYRAVIPDRMRAGISNFFDNALSVETIANDLLQGEFARGGTAFLRFAINTLVGFGGIFDPASEMGLEEHREDFGQTLAVWGVPSGPYVVLPLLGPSTLRDSTRYPVAWFAAPWRYAGGFDGEEAMRALQFIDQRGRAQLALDVRDDSAIDPYLFTKEAWLQRRAFDIENRDAEPIQEDTQAEDDELDDLLDGLDDF